MARRRRGRDVSTPTPSLTVTLPRATVSSVSPLTYNYSILGDRREFHPLRPFTPARTISGGSHARISGRDRPQSDRFAGLRKFPSQTKAVLAFAAPDHTLVCLRRRRRKEVLHALRKAGKRGQRKPRKNWFSKISC